MRTFFETNHNDLLATCGELLYPTVKKTQNRVILVYLLRADEQSHISDSFHCFAQASADGRVSFNSPFVPFLRTSITTSTLFSLGAMMAPASRAIPTSGATTGTPAASASTMLAPQLSWCEVHKTTSATSKNGFGSFQPGNSTGRFIARARSPFSMLPAPSMTSFASTPA